MTATAEITTYDAELAIARQALYRFAALTMLDPRAGSWERLAALRDDDEQLPIEAAALICELPDAAPSQLARGELPIADLDPALVLSRLPGSREAFNAEYERVFGLLVTSAYPPYETEYIHTKFTFQRSNTLADISGFYSAFGLTTSSSHPERPDHIVQQLEFMATLIGLERQVAAGREPQDAERAEVCRQAQVRFLREHLSWWGPVFATLLSQEESSGFYSAAGRFLAALIPAERGLLGVESPNQTAAPILIEQPDACDGCLSPMT